MNEHLDSTSPRQAEVRATSEQAYAADTRRERGAPRQPGAQPCKCGLDTGSRGWRYVVQTH